MGSLSPRPSATRCLSSAAKAARGVGGDLTSFLVASISEEDPTIARDLERLRAVRDARAERAATFFRENADGWDRIRSLYVSETRVEDQLRALAPAGPMDAVLDLGTGTGRMLEIFADRAARLEGVDLSPEMLAFARARLDASGLSHAHVRQGDIFDLTFNDGEFALVSVHQVLHYLDDPGNAVREAGRILAPGGRVLIVDFAPHDLEFLREEHQHRRLGFADEEIAAWAAASGLEVMRAKALPPETKGKDKLTVSLWLLARPGDAKRKSKHQKKTGEAA